MHDAIWNINARHAEQSRAMLYMQAENAISNAILVTIGAAIIPTITHDRSSPRWYNINDRNYVLMPVRSNNSYQMLVALLSQCLILYLYCIIALQWDLSYTPTYTARSIYVPSWTKTDWPVAVDDNKHFNLRTQSDLFIRSRADFSPAMLLQQRFLFVHAINILSVTQSPSPPFSIRILSSLGWNRSLDSLLKATLVHHFVAMSIDVIIEALG